jgi:hypothetical protein
MHGHMDVKCNINSCTYIISKQIRQWAQWNIPSGRSLLSGFIQSKGLVSNTWEKSINSHSNQVLAEENPHQQKNKATSKNFPPMTGVVLFMTF